MGKEKHYGGENVTTVLCYVPHAAACNMQKKRRSAGHQQPFPSAHTSASSEWLFDINADFY